MLKEPSYYASADRKKADLLSDLSVVIQSDPEFVCQLAYYCRELLNLRVTSNFLLAYAAVTPETKPFLPTYFRHAVRLPTDLIEVIQLAADLRNDQQLSRVPKILQRLVKEKFAGFKVYQLGKYCSEGKRKRGLIKAKAASKKNAPAAVSAEPVIAAAKEKKLNMKSLIRLCHVKSPAESVMSVLGKRYPASQDVFADSSLAREGLEFKEDRAGKRMKIPTPVTWETELSAKGNKAEVWEYMVESKKLPFMAMLRNLRNMLITGVRPDVHQLVIDRLRDPEAIRTSRLFPFRFFSAYEAIKVDLGVLNSLKNDPSFEPPKPAGKRGMKKNKRPADKPQKKIIPEIVPTQELLDSYKAALDMSVKLAVENNVDHIAGTAAIFVDVSGSMCCKISGEGGMGSIVSCMQVGMLMGLMIKHIFDEASIAVFAGPQPPHTRPWIEVPITSDNLLENMQAGLSLASQLNQGVEYFPFDYMEDLLEQKKMVDYLFILSDMMIAPGNAMPIYGHIETQWTVSSILEKYRADVNPNFVIVSVNLQGYGKAMTAEFGDDMRNVMINGYSDSILRMIGTIGKSQVQLVKQEAEKLQLASLT
jgi:telomerase protein component 1